MDDRPAGEAARAGGDLVKLRLAEVRRGVIGDGPVEHGRNLPTVERHEVVDRGNAIAVDGLVEVLAVVDAEEDDRAAVDPGELERPVVDRHGVELVEPVGDRLRVVGPVGDGELDALAGHVLGKGVDDLREDGVAGVPSIEVEVAQADGAGDRPGHALVAPLDAEPGQRVRKRVEPGAAEGGRGEFDGRHDVFFPLPIRALSLSRAVAKPVRWIKACEVLSTWSSFAPFGNAACSSMKSETHGTSSRR
ncbi:hypothetical protein D3C72_1135040 [compost metagenome]